MVYYPRGTYLESRCCLFRWDGRVLTLAAMGELAGGHDRSAAFTDPASFLAGARLFFMARFSGDS